MHLVALSVLSGLLALARAQAPAPAGECQTVSEVLSSRQGYQLFGRALQAAGIDTTEFDDEVFTVFLPADTALEPLFAQYELDAQSVATLIASAQDTGILQQLTGFLYYYIAPGAFDAASLQALGTDHLRTLFDSPATCTDPDGQPSAKPADGDLEFGMINGALTITDDSSSTEAGAKVVGTLVTCGGSYIHFIDGALNPCCSVAGDACESAPFTPQQESDASVAVAGVDDVSGTVADAEAPEAAAVDTPDGSRAMVAGAAVAAAALGAALAGLSW